MELLKKETSVFLELDKQELKEIGENASVVDLNKAEQDSSQLIIAAKKAVEILSGYIIGLQSSVIDELYTNGHKKTLTVYGSELSIGSTGNRLDYEQDPEYSRIKAELKEREKWLKEASNTKEEVVINGAVVEGVPLKSASKELLRIKL